MKICIDPGHGMSNRKLGTYDPGATHTENGTTYEEATIALRYGLTLKDILRARGIETFMTRDDADDNAPVGMRARNARAVGCDAFISFHLNDAEADQAALTEALLQTFKSTLSIYKCPRTIRFVTELPQTAAVSTGTCAVRA